jgi:hypothetical protein
MQSENWTVDEGANQFQDGLGHFRAGSEFQNMSECLNGGKKFTRSFINATFRSLNGKSNKKNPVR